VKKWNAKTGSEVKTLEGHTRSITCMAYVPDEQALFTGSDDNKVKKWNVQTGFEVKTLDGHTDRISCMVYIHVPDGAGPNHGFLRQHGEEVECADGLLSEDAGWATPTP